jgi:pSer/pThr/pTyr-binding forkhead associated (FHA) protein
MPIELTIAEGGGRGRSFRLNGVEISIGRDRGNDVVVPHSGVSRRHAGIRRRGLGWLLSDCGSANGTELNGRAVAEAEPLSDGDLIGLGPVVLSFRAIAAADDRGPRAASWSLGVAKARAAVVAAAAAFAAGVPWAVPRSLRGRLAAAGAALLVAGFAATALCRRDAPASSDCPDVVAVDAEMAALSFGHGEVDVECGSAVSFGFDAQPGTRVRFHFQPRPAGVGDLEAKVNGARVFPEGPAGASGGQQTLTLADALLDPSGRNVLSFVPALPAKEWSIARVRVERVEAGPADPKAAQEAYDRGNRKLEERRVAPRNLYDAWSYFVQARRSLEGLAPRPELYGEVARRIAETERQLEKDCARLLFSGARYETYGQDEQARRAYREVLQHFPAEDPWACRRRGRDNLAQLQDGAAANE